MPTLNKPIARYYFGCLLLALEYLHANNIVYRDIKPENSVIDNHGKAYLIDLGTAKELGPANMFKTFTIIGTPHYMAPEVFEGKGYSFEADYWSLGVLLYEFICGRLPFGEHIHNDPYTLYSMIKKDKVSFPKFVSDEKVKSLINFILVKDPKSRSTGVSFEKIKKHEYFAEFSWSDLLEERILPPYIPKDFRNGKTEKNETTG
jgi:cGMP-dependent protein kinase